MKKIIKTSKQAGIEKDLQEIRDKNNLTCPECGYSNNLSWTYHIEGLFHSKRVHSVKCENCGCEFEYDEDI